MLAVPNKRQPGDTLRTTSKNRNDVLLHSLYVGVLRNSSPTTHRGAVWKDGAEIPCQSVLCPQGGFNVPLYFK